MTYIRDDMTAADLANWRYGFDCDDDYPDWYLNVGNTSDEISVILFGA